MALTDTDHLYLIQSDQNGAIKIGRSQDPQERLRQLQTGSPYRLRLVLILPGKGQLERFLHHQLRRGRILGPDKGEWFSYDSLAELPTDIYEQLDLAVVDWWWTETGKPP